MYITSISEVLAVWGMDEGAGVDALLRCAVDAAALTVDGEPWSIKSLCVRYCDLYGGTVDAVKISMERALANAGVKITLRRALCVLVGHAIRGRLYRRGCSREN